MKYITIILIVFATCFIACKKNKCECIKLNHCTTLKYTLTVTNLITQQQNTSQHTASVYCEKNYSDHLAYITAIAYQQIVIQNNYPCSSPDSSCSFIFNNEEVLSEKIVKKIPIGFNRKDKINFYTKEGYNCNCN
jgi:hypothetical protein